MPDQQPVRTIYDTIESFSTSPLPAFVFGNLLILKGAVSSFSPSNVTTSGGGGTTVIKPVKQLPTRVSCFGFGSAQLLGAWLMYDGEPVNAAGFNFAWLTLYLIVNGRSSLKSIFHGRASPLGLSMLALTNTGIYGREFFWPREMPLQ